MSDLTFRFAQEADLPAIVTLLADDDISAGQERNAPQLAPEYIKAFGAMSRELANRVLLAERRGEIVGALQLVFIPCLSRRGATRALIQSTRVASSVRGGGIGTALVSRALEEARRAGCGFALVLSDKRRARAHLFYRRLGFQQNHEGFTFKL